MERAHGTTSWENSVELTGHQVGMIIRMEPEPLSGPESLPTLWPSHFRKRKELTALEPGTHLASSQVMGLQVTGVSPAPFKPALRLKQKGFWRLDR